MKTLFYYETGNEMREGVEYYHPHFTFSKREAKQGNNFRIATMEDLNYSDGTYDVDKMYEGLFQIWNEKTESLIIVRFDEIYEFDDLSNEYEVVDCEFRQATPKEIQSLSCDVCTIRDECENRIKIA